MIIIHGVIIWCLKSDVGKTFDINLNVNNLVKKIILKFQKRNLKLKYFIFLNQNFSNNITSFFLFLKSF